MGTPAILPRLMFYEKLRAFSTICHARQYNLEETLPGVHGQHGTSDQFPRKTSLLHPRRDGCPIQPPELDCSLTVEELYAESGLDAGRANSVI